MPVPKSTVENSPRKLLRDVVYDKMLAALRDGTLQHGERLNDDELVQWLGVSRTPIREAIAKLVDFGLVEMEANRYTRIATPNAKQFDDTLQVLGGFTELAARWAVPKLDDGTAADVIDALEDMRAGAEREDLPSTNAALDRVVRLLITHSDNELLAKISESVLPRARFLALSQSRGVFWDVRHFIDPLRAAVTRRDGEAASATIRSLTTTIDDASAAVRARRDADV